MKLSNHYPSLKSKPAIKSQILRNLRKYQKTKPRGGEYDYMLFLDIAKKHDINYEDFKKCLSDLISQKKVVMNERGFCVKRDLA